MLNRQHPNAYIPGRCDTETNNIWSHLLSMIWFSFSTARFLCNRAALLRNIPILMYLLACAFCFWCSTMYHILARHPETDVWQNLDHIGIIATIWSSAVLLISFSFEDQKQLQKAHMLLINLATVLCLIRLSWIQHYHCEKRQAHIVTHACFGGLATIPALHCWHQPYTRNRYVELLRPFWVLVLTASVGGEIYATKLLNYAGFQLGISDASHNVMHVAVVIGDCIYEHSLLSIR